jgi:hypothetical protein
MSCVSSFLIPRRKLPNILSREEVARLIEASGSLFTFPVCETNQCVGERSQPALLKTAWE